jgi:D-beta-D-heptose 7-phosphate kinase / D-beta-D-heptose 1-phosphate adenosyltransferase
MSADQSLVERLARARVLVLGDVMLDRYVYGEVERMSPEAPVPVLREKSQRAMPGGAGNVARNVAALGARALLIGLVGDDGPGRELAAMLGEEPGIEPRLIIDPARHTTLKTRFVVGRQQLLRVDDETPIHAARETAAALLSALQASLPAVDIVLFSDYAKGVLSDDVLARAIAAVHGAGKRLIADPKSRDFARYAGADLLTPNRQELIAATGVAGDDDEAVVAAARKAMAGARLGALLTTRGERGMTLVAGDGPALHIASEGREVFDVSGAGDTVIATLGVLLAAGADPFAAVRIAKDRKSVV